MSYPRKRVSRTITGFPLKDGGNDGARIIAIKHEQDVIRQTLIHGAWELERISFDE